VRDLHHGGLDVQGEHHAGLVRVFNLLLVELQEGLFAHVHAVDHFAIEQRHFFLEHDGFATLGDELHAHIAGPIQRHGFFAMVEIAMVHV